MSTNQSRSLLEERGDRAITLLSFASAHWASAAQALLRQLQEAPPGNAYAARIAQTSWVVCPTPRILSAACGISLEFDDPALEPALREVLLTAGLPPETWSIHRLRHTSQGWEALEN